jgi:hypothetical protein
MERPARRKEKKSVKLEAARGDILSNQLIDDGTR